MKIRVQYYSLTVSEPVASKHLSALRALHPDTDKLTDYDEVFVKIYENKPDKEGRGGTLK